jgi:hypothetical protein
MNSKSIVGAVAAVLFTVAGCDSNRNGPSAPSPSAVEPATPPAGGAQPKAPPLKPAGQPIGLVLPR